MWGKMLNQKCISFALFDLFYPHSVLALVIELGLIFFLVLNFVFFFNRAVEPMDFLTTPVSSSNPLLCAMPDVLFMVENENSDLGEWLI